MTIEKRMVDELELYKNIMENCSKYDEDMDFTVEIRMQILSNLEKSIKHWHIPKCIAFDKYTPDEIIYWYFNKMEMKLNEYYRNIGFIE